MKQLLIAFFLLMVERSMAQTVEQAAHEEIVQVETKVDQHAAYPGGMKGVLHYIAYHVRYPIEAMKAGAQGKVFVKFTVGPVGKVVKTEVLKSDNKLLEPGATSVFMEMPDWKPAYLNDQPIEVSYVLPVVFKWEGLKKN